MNSEYTFQYLDSADVPYEPDEDLEDEDDEELDDDADLPDEPEEISDTPNE